MIYQVIDSSFTNHCCFDCSVIFTDENGEDKMICERLDFKSAFQICSVLNKVAELRAERNDRLKLIEEGKK